MDKKQLWSLMNDTMQALAPFYREAMSKAIQEIEAPNSWFTLTSARGSDPRPVTVEHLHALSPYNSQERVAQRLDELAGLELLERVSQGAYRLTDLGREAIEGVFGAAQQALQSIDFLPAEDLQETNRLLWRLVEATLAAPEPAGKWSMIYSRWTDPGEEGHAVVKMDQYLTDLARFRDSAHLAAWQPYDVSGPAWEALTFVWRDEAHTAQELLEKLPNRGLTVEDYAQTLGDLVGRGWLAEKEGVFELTPEGKRVREKAEEDTDRHFLVGFAALDDDELARLQDFCVRTTESLRAATLKQIWDLAGQVSQGIYPLTRAVVNPLLEGHGLDKPGFFFLLLFATSLEPEFVSSARLYRRSPYTRQARADKVLADMAEAGLFVSQGEGQYRVSDKGRQALQESNHAFYTRLGEISVLPEADMAQVVSLLTKLAQASLESPQPADKVCITQTQQSFPSQEYAPLATIDQRLDELNAFRDDVHLAAWRPHEVEGLAWEALTFIWRGDASSAAELVEKLSVRDYSVDDYEQALAGLAQRGWLEKTDDGYLLTPQGQTVRQQAEEDTDRYFFAPWACLSDAESVQLHDLLTRLKNELQRQAAPDDAESA